MKEVLGGARTVVLTARDLARSRAFWVERMGFRLMKEEPGRFVQVNLGNFRLRLETSGEVRRPRGAGVAVVFQVRNLARTARELDERGVAYEEIAPPDGGASLETGDPDGHRLVFRERL